MTYAEEEQRETLRYRFIGSKEEDIGSWGHEYVRHLSGEIMKEYEARTENDESVEDLLKLALEIVPFFLKHNAEADAVDLLLELEAIEELPAFVDKDTFERVCLYMLGYAFFTIYCMINALLTRTNIDVSTCLFLRMIFDSWRLSVQSTVSKANSARH